MIAFQTLDPAEIEFPFDDVTLFKGMEEAGDLLTEPRSLRAAYLEQLAAHTDGLRKLCRGLKVDFSRISTGDPLDVALSGYLATRAASHQVSRNAKVQNSERRNIEPRKMTAAAFTFFILHFDIAALCTFDRTTFMPLAFAFLAPAFAVAGLAAGRGAAADPPAQPPAVQDRRLGGDGLPAAGDAEEPPAGGGFEQWLLLACRCLVLAALGLALSRPLGCDASSSVGGGTGRGPHRACTCS